MISVMTGGTGSSPSGWTENISSGERAMIKVKRLRTADCVVGGFRYLSGSDEVGSLLLGLYNAQGLLGSRRLHLDDRQ